MTNAIEQLERDGYVILPALIPPTLCRELLDTVEQLFATEGDDAGSEFKQEPGSRRLANLMDKGAIFQRVIENDRVLELIHSVLGPKFKLSSLNARSVNPHNATVQPLHADMAAVPDHQGYWVCNSVWMLTEFTAENGPTRIVPGSHKWGRLPQDPASASVDPVATHPAEVKVTGPPGTVAVMNAHAWHGGLANQTDHPRTALHAFFTRWDKPQQQFQKQLIRPSIQAGFSPRLRELLALDDENNDRLSANPDVRSGFLK